MFHPSAHRLFITLIGLIFNHFSVAQSQFGADIYGEAYNDRFGVAISMPMPNILAVGGH